MQNLTAREIRQKYIEFFESKGHKHLPSSPLVPYNDPTVLLTTAGMLQFKPIMFGTEEPVYSRVTTYQKCFRTTDLENVGFTPRHHTFFEMLGNFSFGDYYKTEAISWAWELMTEVFGIPPERLSVTVFTTDDEAAALWRDVAGLPPERIVRLGADSNFWAAGDTGPCGPCSEIYFDQGTEIGCKPACQAGCDNCNRFLEVWNLVFMEFNRQPDGSLVPLPAKNIDTGMGLERIASVLQEKKNNYESDLLDAIIREARKLATGIVKTVSENDGKRTITALQVIADHSRASVHLIADGVVPGNEGRGYVLRRIMRRAIRFGHLIGIESPFMHKLISVIQEQYQGIYPEIAEKRSFIEENIQAEEERFSKTLERGIKKLSEAIQTLRENNQTIIPGSVAFELYDTYGFPLELTREIAEERQLQIESVGYHQEMQKQVERARAAARKNLDVASGILDLPPTAFTGYQELVTESLVLAVLEASAPDLRRLVLNQSPFYAESGGQVSDHGAIHCGAHRFEVVDVQKVGEVFVHIVRGTDWGELKVGDSVTCSVESEIRAETMKHHSATHLMHAALKKVLGEHVSQSGSEVTHYQTRFDITFNRALKAQELQAIEEIVNDQIMRNAPVQVDLLPLDEAKASGAIAMFGEKYAQEVRVITMGGFSKELCGGTHVPATGVIGLFKIIAEEAVSAGNRRITAIVGKTAYRFMSRHVDALKTIAQDLRVPLEEVPERFRKLQDTLRAQEQELQQLKNELGMQQVQALLGRFQLQGNIHCLAQKIQVPDTKVLKQIAEALVQQKERSLVVLTAIVDAKVNLVVAVAPELIPQGYHAGKLVQALAPLVGAKGGGKPNFAQAGGGTEVDGIPPMLAALPQLLQQTAAIS